MNWARLFIIIVVVFIVQTVVVPYLSIFGIVPDLLLVLVAIFSIISGRKYGMVVGGICGVLQDIFSSTVYVHTISKITVGYIIGFIKENILGREETISVVTVFIVSVISAVIDVAFLYFFIGRPVSTAPYILLTIVLYSVYNSILVPVLYPIFKLASFEK